MRNPFKRRKSKESPPEPAKQEDKKNHKNESSSQNKHDDEQEAPAMSEAQMEAEFHQMFMRESERVEKRDKARAFAYVQWGEPCQLID